MDMLDIILHRRSIRQYTDEAIPEEKLMAILHAGLAAASSKNRRPWDFILIQDRSTLDKLSACRPGAANLLGKCKAAIVVTADADLVDVWVEDCASAITQMHLMADALGVGSCWLQVRMRKTPDGLTDSQAYVRSVLGIPANYGVMAMLTLGMPAIHPGPKAVEELPLEKIHYDHF